MFDRDCSAFAVWTDYGSFESAAFVLCCESSFDAQSEFVLFAEELFDVHYCLRPFLVFAANWGFAVFRIYGFHRGIWEDFKPYTAFLAFQEHPANTMQRVVGAAYRTIRHELHLVVHNLGENAWQANQIANKSTKASTNGHFGEGFAGGIKTARIPAYATTRQNARSKISPIGYPPYFKTSATIAISKSQLSNMFMVRFCRIRSVFGNKRSVLLST